MLKGKRKKSAPALYVAVQLFAPLSLHAELKAEFCGAGVGVWGGGVVSGCKLICGSDSHDM